MQTKLNTLKKASTAVLISSVFLLPVPVWSQSTAPSPAATAITKNIKTNSSAPDELSAFGGGLQAWRLQGTGALRFIGFKAYDASL